MEVGIVNVTKTVRVDLSEEELKSIIAEYVGKKVNKDIKPESVCFNIGKKFDNDIDDRFGTDYIKNCSVTYSEK